MQIRFEIKNKNELKKKIINIIILTFLFGILAHGYRYTRSNVNHDSIFLSQTFDIDHIVSIGRFFQPVYFFFRGFVTVPYLIGILQLLFLGLQNYIIIEFLGINDVRLKVISVGILTTNFVVSLTNATYITFSDIYAFAQLLSVFSLFLLYKFNKPIVFIISSFALAISLGIYQSNYQLVIALCIIYSIKEVLENKEFTVIIKQGVKAIAYLLFSMALYLLINKFSISLLNLSQLEAYNSVSKVSKLLDLHVIIFSLTECFLQEIDWLVGKNSFGSTVVFFINIFILICSVLLIIKCCIRNRTKKENIFLLIALIVVLPFGMNIMGFLAIGDQHDLMSYSFFTLYLLVIVIIDLLKDSGSIFYSDLYKIYQLLFSILLFSNIVYSNNIYYEKELNEKTTYMALIKITNSIEQIDGYDINKTKVALFGSLAASDINKNREEFDSFYGTGLEHKYSITYLDTYTAYISDILAYPMLFANDDERVSLANNDYVINMPIYPSKESIQMVDGIVVVKLSNW